MSLKIVNEYITEVLQLKSFRDHLEDELKKLEPKPAVEVKPDPDPDDNKESNDNPEILVDPNAELFFQRINRRR